MPLFSRLIGSPLPAARGHDFLRGGIFTNANKTITMKMMAAM
jgi:hypothetical protein